MEELLALRLEAGGALHADTVATAWDLLKVRRDIGDKAGVAALRRTYVAPLLALPEASMDVRQQALATQMREEGG
jgi:hypothetical protein